MQSAMTGFFRDGYCDNGRGHRQPHRVRHHDRRPGLAVLASDFVTAVSDSRPRIHGLNYRFTWTTLATTYRTRILNAVAPSQHLRVLRQPICPRASRDSRNASQFFSAETDT